MKLGQPLAQMITFGKERPVAILTLCFLAAVGGKTFLFLTKGLAALALERFQLSPEVGILSIDARYGPNSALCHTGGCSTNIQDNAQSQDLQRRENRERDNCCTGFRTCRYRREGNQRVSGGALS